MYALGSFESSKTRSSQLLVVAALFLAACGQSGGFVEPPVEPPPEVDQPEFSYSERVLLTELGVAMAPLTPVVTGPEQIQTWSLEGELPPGLSFDPQSGEISGTPTELSPSRALTVVGTNADGSDSVRLTVSVSGVQRFAYSANSGDNTLGLLVANQVMSRLENNGFLTQSPGESNPQDIQADPYGRLVYAVNSFALTPYLVDAQSGKLVAGTPLAIGAGPHSLYVHPGGEFVYLTSSGTDRLRVLAVDAALGQLSEVQQVLTAVEPTDIAGDPSGRFLVVGHENSQELRSYMIDPDSGELLLAQPLALPGAVAPDIEVDPLGEALYVVLRQPLEGVLRCAVDPETAQMTIGSTVSSGSSPLAMVVEPGRRFAYVLNQGSGDISYYSVASSNGKLTRLGELPSTAGAVSMRFSGDGRTALVIDQTSREARRYELQADGTLLLDGSTRLRQAPVALASVEGAGSVARAADRIYVLNSDAVPRRQRDRSGHRQRCGALPHQHRPRRLRPRPAGPLRLRQQPDREPHPGLLGRAQRRPHRSRDSFRSAGWLRSVSADRGPQRPLPLRDPEGFQAAGDVQDRGRRLADEPRDAPDPPRARAPGHRPRGALPVRGAGRQPSAGDRELPQLPDQRC